MGPLFGPISQVFPFSDCPNLLRFRASAPTGRETQMFSRDACFFGGESGGEKERLRGVVGDSTCGDGTCGDGTCGDGTCGDGTCGGDVGTDPCIISGVVGVGVVGVVGVGVVGGVGVGVVGVVGPAKGELARHVCCGVGERGGEGGGEDAVRRGDDWSLDGVGAPFFLKKTRSDQEKKKKSCFKRKKNILEQQKEEHQSTHFDQQYSQLSKHKFVGEY